MAPFGYTESIGDNPAEAKLGTSPPGRSETWTHALAIGFFVLLTLVVTWPLPLHMADRVPGWYAADNYEYLWKMWWFKHALMDTQQNPLIAPHIFYPQGYWLAFAEITPLHTIAGLPFTWLWGEIPTYNLFAMLSFIVSGWAAFALVHRVTGNFTAGLLAGTLFALSPYHVERYGGILPLMSVEGIPIFFLGLEAWADTRKLRWVWLAGLGFALAAWASIYYAAGLVLLAPVYALVRFGNIKSLAKDRGAWLAFGVFASITLAASIPLAIPYIQLSQITTLRIPLDEVDFWSASFSDYIIPPGLHPLWGSWVRDHLLSIPADRPQIGLEFVLGVGFVALVFAIYGLRYWRGDARRALVWLTLAALILSFGPRLHLGRHPVIIPAPEAAVQLFNSPMNAIGRLLPAGETYEPLAENGITIPLPALFLRWLITPLAGMRAWNRFAAYGGLGVALLAGVGYAAWVSRELAPQQNAARRIRIAGAIVLAIAIFELWPVSIPLQKVEPRPVDSWLAAQPEQFTIMELPLASAMSGPNMMYTRYHGKRTAFGGGTYFPYWYRRQFPELLNCPEPACLDRLRSWEVRYVLLNLDGLPADSHLESDLDQSGGLRRVTQISGIAVYELLPPESK